MFWGFFVGVLFIYLFIFGGGGALFVCLFLAYSLSYKQIAKT